VSIFKDGAYYPLGTGEEMSEGEYEYQYALCNDPGEFYDDGPSAKSLDSVPAGKWRVRGGAVLEIVGMSVEHLRNAINLFERAGWADHMKIRELREELARRKRVVSGRGLR
jgi:hypothetical protein